VVDEETGGEAHEEIHHRGNASKSESLVNKGIQVL
jgi:hypothetical protein